MVAKSVTNKLSIEIFTLADYAFLSKGENKLNIIGIFDIFGIAQVPVRWPRMSLVAVFKGDPGDTHTINVKISSPEKVILNQDFPVKLGQNGKSNFISTLNNFPLESYGEYQIKVSEEGKKIGDYRFSVIKRKAASPKKPEGLVN